MQASSINSEVSLDKSKLTEVGRDGFGMRLGSLAAGFKRFGVFGYIMLRLEHLNGLIGVDVANICFL